MDFPVLAESSDKELAVTEDTVLNADTSCVCAPAAAPLIWVLSGAVFSPRSSLIAPTLMGIFRHLFSFFFAISRKKALNCAIALS